MSDQHMKKLMSLREGLHLMMHCDMRQHLLIVTGCMSIQEDMRRGENPRCGNLQKHQPHTLYEDLCADGMFSRCNQNQTYVKQRVSSHTVGEPN